MDEKDLIRYSSDGPFNRTKLFPGRNVYAKIDDNSTPPGRNLCRLRQIYNSRSLRKGDKSRRDTGIVPINAALGKKAGQCFDRIRGWKSWPSRISLRGKSILNEALGENRMKYSCTRSGKGSSGFLGNFLFKNIHFSLLRNHFRKWLPRYSWSKYFNERQVRVSIANLMHIGWCFMWVNWWEFLRFNNTWVVLESEWHNSLTVIKEIMTMTFWV